MAVIADKPRVMFLSLVFLTLCITAVKTQQECECPTSTCTAQVYEKNVLLHQYLFLTTVYPTTTTTSSKNSTQLQNFLDKWQNLIQCVDCLKQEYYCEQDELKVFYKVSYAEHLEKAIQLDNTVNYNPECIHDFLGDGIQFSIEPKYKGNMKILNKDEWCKEQTSVNSLLPGCQANFKKVCNLQNIIDLLPKRQTNKIQGGFSQNFENQPMTEKEKEMDRERYKLLRKFNNEGIKSDSMLNINNNQSLEINNRDEDNSQQSENENNELPQNFSIVEEPIAERDSQLDELEEQIPKKIVLKLLKSQGEVVTRTAVLVPPLTPKPTPSPTPIPTIDDLIDIYEEEEDGIRVERKNLSLQNVTTDISSTEFSATSDSQKSYKYTYLVVFAIVSLLIFAGLLGVVVLVWKFSSCSSSSRKVVLAAQASVSVDSEDEDEDKKDSIELINYVWKFRYVDIGQIP